MLLIIIKKKNAVFWDVASQKAAFFIVTAVKTANLTSLKRFEVISIGTMLQSRYESAVLLISAIASRYLNSVKTPIFTFCRRKSHKYWRLLMATAYPPPLTLYF
jgi:hypothetical protein